MIHINDLPVELLSEIFDFSVMRSHLSKYSFVPLLRSIRPRCSPFNVIHVCQHWRRVAFSTPSLWSYISGGQWKPCRADVQEMSYWLQWSRNAPLHFRLASRPDRRRDFDPQHSLKMLNLFSEYMDRWQTLSLQPDAELVIRFVVLLRSTVDRMPPLIGLEVNLEFEQVPQALVEEFASRISSLRSLRKLHWMNRRNGFNLPNLPWEQYDNILMHARFTVEDSITFLSRCASAVSVALHGFRNPEFYSTSSNHPHTTLRHLTALTLDRSSDPLRALPFFTLPSLRFLEIGLHSRNFENLENFLQRSKCPLRELVVIDLELDADDIAAFFRFSWLKPILNVKLGPTHDGTKMLRFIQRFDKAGLVLPDLFVWLEPVINWPLLVGWKESRARGTYYSYENGKLRDPNRVS